MELKIITEDHESMNFFRNFIYNEDNKLSVDETYEYSDGCQKEAVVVAITLALTSPMVLKMITKMFDSYLEYKKSIKNSELEHERIILEKERQKESGKDIEITFTSTKGRKSIRINTSNEISQLENEISQLKNEISELKK